jgi:signal transduction histidine kinase
MAARLRHDVLPTLDAAIERLPAAGTATTSTSASTDHPLAVVRTELAAASTEVLGLVEGIPPEPLGEGRLATALRSLAERSPVPVQVRVEPGAQADTATETAAYYVCAEAVTNAVKHAHATAIHVVVTQADGGVAVTVSDDGCGGADASGSGLRGLADRVAAAEGHLTVLSPPGGGTTLSAWLPLSRSAARG